MGGLDDAIELVQAAWQLGCLVVRSSPPPRRSFDSGILAIEDAFVLGLVFASRQFERWAGFN
jgi:hypothetical protein